MHRACASASGIFSRALTTSVTRPFRCEESALTQASYRVVIPVSEPIHACAARDCKPKHSLLKVTRSVHRLLSTDDVLQDVLCKPTSTEAALQPQRLNRYILSTQPAVGTALRFSAHQPKAVCLKTPQHSMQRHAHATKHRLIPDDCLAMLTRCSASSMLAPRTVSNLSSQMPARFWALSVLARKPMKPSHICKQRHVMLQAAERTGVMSSVSRLLLMPELSAMSAITRWAFTCFAIIFFSDLVCKSHCQVGKEDDEWCSANGTSYSCNFFCNKNKNKM